MEGQKAFNAKPKINIMFASEENVFRVPNQKKNEDCYENQCLSNLIDEFDSHKNRRMKSF